MKDWKHINFEQRKVISSGISHNYKVKEIADTLGINHTSISMTESGIEICLKKLGVLGGFV